MSRDDSLSRQIAGDKRRKRRNLVATNPSAGGADIVTDPAALSGAWCVPTDEQKVLDLRFDSDKYPKINTDTNATGSQDPKTDVDGTIALSRTVWDASVLGLHHKVETWDGWEVGPSGTVSTNPLGDWVYDWPRPVPGVAGWGLRIPSWTDYLNLSGGTSITPSGCVAYVPASDADLRGPDGEFNQMSGFTYLFWFRPSFYTDWEFYLASIFDSAADSLYDSTLAKTFTRERAGWNFAYAWYPPNDHELYFVSESDAGSYAAVWVSGDNGKCDLSFGEAVDTALHNAGLVATVPAFVALVVSPATGAGTSYLTNFESDGTDDQTFSDAPTFDEMARSFTPANDQTATAVSLRLQQRDGVTYTDERLTIEIYSDSGGSGPDAKLGGTFARGYIPATDIPSSAASPDWVRCVLDDGVDLTASTRYWVHITPNAAIDGFHRIGVYGTDDVGEVDPTEETRWFRTPGNTWDAVDVDVDFRVEGVSAASATVAVDVYVGNPRTGVLSKPGAAESVISGTIVDPSAVPAPKGFSAADNQSQHVVGNIRQRRQDSEYAAQTSNGAYGVFDGVVRHNRALGLPEIRGAFIAGLRREWAKSTPHIVSDVDNTGESASEVSTP